MTRRRRPFGQTASLPRRPDRRSGFSLLFITVVLAAMLVFGIALVSMTVSSGRVSKMYAGNVSAVQIADAGVSKALYCMRNGDPAKCDGYAGGDFVGETDVSFGSGTYTSVLTGVSRERLLTVIATDAAGNKRKVQVEITHNPAGERLQWDFALYADHGGLNLAGQSQVLDGPINSDSNVECGNGAEIFDNVYVSVAGGRIFNCQMYADAYADNIINTNMHYNDIYYSQAITGTSNIGISYPNSPTPTEVDLPSVELGKWHNSAAAGGTLEGDHTPANGSHLGPVKINGDLILEEGRSITVDGPIWVTGNIQMDQNSGFYLNENFDRNSTVILADSETDTSTFGKINIENGAEISGSSDERSFIVMISTNTSTSYTSPAMSIANGAGGSLFLAPYGAVRVINNAGATTVAGYRVYVDQNAIIDFNSAYTNPTDVILAENTVSDWHLRPGTWRELTP